MKSVREIYEGSDGDATKELYARLATLGAHGEVALNLFRACKASERAKKYRRRFKGAAYDKKNWSLKLLCDALAVYQTAVATELRIRYWGWKEDPTQEFHKWVLYVDLPTGQVSFHAASPLSEQRYNRDWDGQHISARRIVAYVDHVLNPDAAPAMEKACPQAVRDEGVTAPTACDQDLFGMNKSGWIVSVPPNPSRADVSKS